MPSRKEDATLFRLLMATKAKLLNLKTGPSEKPAYNNRSKIPFPKIDYVSCSLTSLSIIFAINLFNSEASYPIFERFKGKSISLLCHHFIVLFLRRSWNCISDLVIAWACYSLKFFFFGGPSIAASWTSSGTCLQILTPRLSLLINAIWSSKWKYVSQINAHKTCTSCHHHPYFQHMP